MITLFSTPKPFRGHTGVIQRNALLSWTRLGRDVEIILVGDDEGTAQTCEQLGLRHEPEVRRSASGPPYLNDIFRIVQERAAHQHICYLNCDIILLPDFVAAAHRVMSWRTDFLMVGQRMDLDITEPVDVAAPSWEAELRGRVAQGGVQRDQWWIDYFFFNRRMFRSIPDFLVGRAAWDNWMIWKARHDGHAVIDATPSVLAIHQNHDYAHHPQGQAGVFKGAEAAENRRLAGGRDHLYRISDANYRLTTRGIRPNLTLPHVKRVVDNRRRAARRVFRAIRSEGFRGAWSR